MEPSRYDIPIGEDHAISRSALAWKWKKSDRKTRDIVAKMRNVFPEDGYIIMSTSHGTGYWRTNDPDEIDQFINETIARTNNTLRPALIAMQVRGSIGQIAMDL